MKKTIKVMAAIMLVAAMVLGIAACGGGLDMNKIKGEWTITSINGQTVAEYAASKGAAAYQCAANYTITDDKIIASGVGADGNIATSEFVLKKNADGVEGYLNDTLVLSFIYDAKADKINYGVETPDGTRITNVLTKGTTDLQALLNEAAGGAAQAQEGGEAQEGGAEEGGAEEGGAEEGGEEE